MLFSLSARDLHSFTTFQYHLLNRSHIHAIKAQMASTKSHLRSPSILLLAERMMEILRRTSTIGNFLSLLDLRPLLLVYRSSVIRSLELWRSHVLFCDAQIGLSGDSLLVC